MLELRWLEKKILIRTTDDAVIGYHLKRVLQYRQQLMMPVGGWTQSEEPQRRPEWTPWADVLTVKGY